MNLSSLFLSFIIFLMFLLFGLFFISEGLNKNIGVEKVPCYDRYGNVIEGLVCDDETTKDDKDALILGGGFLMIMGLGFSILFYYFNSRDYRT